MFDELRDACRPGGVGGFLPAMKQIANVAALPGIVSVGFVSLLSSFCTVRLSILVFFRSRLVFPTCIPDTVLLLETWPLSMWKIRNLSFRQVSVSESMRLWKY